MRTLFLTLLLVGSCLSLRAQIRLLEYGWDTDKGHGLNTLVNVTGTGNDADVDVKIPFQGLGNGYHLLFVRTQDARNRWSHTYLRLVNIRAGAVPARIVQLDYTYTQGATLVGQYAYKIPNPATTVQLTIPGDVAKLVAGQTYTLSIWATDENGTRSQVYMQTFTYRAVDCKGLAVTAPAVGSLCKNGSTVIAATAAGGTTPITYSWSRAGAEVGRTSSLTVTQAGQYSVRATDGLGCVSTATVDVRETPSPDVSVPATATFCAGQSTNLTASASGGTGPYTYQWRQGTAGLVGSGATLAVSAVGTYAVTATDANGCASTAASAVVTQRAAPVATVIANAAGFITGGSVSLSANTGSGLTYQWTRDGQPIAGATQATYTVQQPGSYAVVVSQNGCSATASAVTISLITALNEPQPGSAFTLSASPNPSVGLVDVRLYGPRGRTLSVGLFVTDLSGRALVRKIVNVSGQHTERLDLSAHPAGLYLLNATIDGQVIRLRLLRQ